MRSHRARPGTRTRPAAAPSPDPSTEATRSAADVPDGHAVPVVLTGETGPRD